MNALKQLIQVHYEEQTYCEQVEEKKICTFFMQCIDSYSIKEFPCFYVEYDFQEVQSLTEISDVDSKIFLTRFSMPVLVITQCCVSTFFNNTTLKIFSRIY